MPRLADIISKGKTKELARLKAKLKEKENGGKKDGKQEQSAVAVKL